MRKMELENIHSTESQQLQRYKVLLQESAKTGNPLALATIKLISKYGEMDIRGEKLYATLLDVFVAQLKQLS